MQRMRYSITTYHKRTYKGETIELRRCYRSSVSTNILIIVFESVHGASTRPPSVRFVGREITKRKWMTHKKDLQVKIPVIRIHLRMAILFPQKCASYVLALISTEPTREGTSCLTGTAESEEGLCCSCLYRATLIRYISLSTGALGGAAKRPILVPSC